MPCAYHCRVKGSLCLTDTLPGGLSDIDKSGFPVRDHQWSRPCHDDGKALLQGIPGEGIDLFAEMIYVPEGGKYEIL